LDVVWGQVESLADLES